MDLDRQTRGHALTGMTSPPELARCMNFPSGDVAHFAVQDYALYYDKRVKLGSRGGKARKLLCTSSVPCPFFVQLCTRRGRKSEGWYVSSLNLTHSPECDSKPQPTQRQLEQMPMFIEALRKSPIRNAKDLMRFVPEKTSLRMIYRARNALRDRLRGELSTAYSKIPAFIQSYQESNPGSFTKYEVDDHGAFSRAFISCAPIIASMSANQQILGLDTVGARDAEAEYGGTHLYLFGKDGNRATLILAAAVCDMPSQDNYRWFLEMAQQAGLDIHSRPIICALDGTLLALESQMNLTFRMCTKYIIESGLTQGNAIDVRHTPLVYGLQESETPAEFSHRLSWLRKVCGDNVADYLEKIPIHRWTVGGNLHTLALYGNCTRRLESTETSNMDAKPSDRLSTIISELSTKLPYDFLERIIMVFMEDLYQRSKQASEWILEGRKLVPGAQVLYDKEFRQQGNYEITSASETIVFASKLKDTSARRRRVDLRNHTCTCPFMDQHSIPCRHLLAALLYSHQPGTAYESFASCYLVESFASAFQGKSLELPLDTNLPLDESCSRAESSIHPLGPKRGRKSKKRSATELNDLLDASGINTEPVEEESGTDGEKKAPRACKTCGHPGHNRRTCPNTLTALRSALL